MYKKVIYTFASAALKNLPRRVFVSPLSMKDNHFRDHSAMHDGTWSSLRKSLWRCGVNKSTSEEALHHGAYPLWMGQEDESGLENESVSRQSRLC